MLKFLPDLTFKEIKAFLSFKRVDGVDIVKPWCREGDEAFLFSRSSWALLGILNWFKKARQQSEVTLWLPEYFCSGPLASLRDSSIHIIFYPLDACLKPDWSACDKLAESNSPSMFVLVHFFGKMNDVKLAKKFCRKQQSLFVEDCAHVLMPTPGIGERCDFSFYSLHKFFSVPDGSVCVMSPSASRFCEDHSSLSYFHEVISCFSRKKSCFFAWFLKRLVIKFLYRLGLSTFLKNRKRQFNLNKNEFVEQTSYLMSDASKRIMLCSIPKIPSIIEHRRRTNQLWLAILKGCFDLQPFFDEVSDSTPYLSVFLARNRGDAESAYACLQSLGISVQTWPDLPKEIIENPEKYKVAIKYRYSLITLPIHEGATMRALSKVFFRVHRKSYRGIFTYKMHKDHWSRKQWDEAFLKIDRSNMLQAWAYGEAKYASDALKPARYVITRNEEPVALCQCLKKSIFGLFDAFRLNRGPVWLLKPENLHDIFCVYQIIISQFCFWKRRLFFASFDCIDVLEFHLVLNNLMMLKVKKPAWSSAWLDISLSEEALRKQLTSRWRSHLKVSEKNAMILNTSHSEADFNQLMEGYVDFKKTKNFSGPSVSLLKNLFKESRGKNCVILKALSNNEEVSTVLIFRHGISCTYLISWNSVGGRELGANYFLLWNAILEMKAQGCRWFDLGGISDETPRIASFKRGMNGAEYRLVGEYFC